MALLASACGQDVPAAAVEALSAQDADGIELSSVPADAADAAQGAFFAACGVRFLIPEAWQPVAHDDAHWELMGDAARAGGMSVVVRCLDEPVSPATHYTDIDAVREAFGEGGPEFDQAHRYYLSWLDPLPRRPYGLIALRQEQHEGPGRVEVAVWIEGDRRTPSAPRRDHQGMIAVHWSQDDPAQVQQYDAFRASFDPSFTTTSPRIGRNRANTP